MKRFLAAALCALLLLAPAGCALSGGNAPVSSAGAASSSAPGAASSAETTVPAVPIQPPADPIDTLLSGMTLEQKVGQLFFVRCPESGAGEDVGRYHPGGFLLFGRDFRDRTANEIIQSLSAYQDAAAADSGIPLLLGVDEEGGTVVRVSSNPNLCRDKFRSPRQLLSDGGVEELLRETHEKDVLLRALGINVNLGPVCDVSTDPSDFIYPRTCGADAPDTARCVGFLAGQMADDGMGAVLKHFPGYGNNADTHTGIAVDERPAKTFESSDFLPFRAGIAAGKTAAVLVCHNIVKAYDPDLPASLSPAVHRLLRQELDFDGVIMTDDLAMDAVGAYAADGNMALLALQAGNDMVITTDYKTQIPRVLSAVRDGALEESAVDDACRRVLRWKQALGLL